jgi:subtilisin family serine protease
VPSSRKTLANVDTIELGQLLAQKRREWLRGGSALSRTRFASEQRRRLIKSWQKWHPNEGPAPAQITVARTVLPKVTELQPSDVKIIVPPRPEPLMTVAAGQAGAPVSNERQRALRVKAGKAVIREALADDAPSPTTESRGLTFVSALGSRRKKGSKETKNPVQLTHLRELNVWLAAGLSDKQVSNLKERGAKVFDNTFVPVPRAEAVLPGVDPRNGPRRVAAAHSVGQDVAADTSFAYNEANFWHLDKINRKAAGPLTGKGVVIGIIDTGADGTHSELRDRIVAFRSFARNDRARSNRKAKDFERHGTHVAALAAGRNMGVAPGARLAVAAVLTERDPATGLMGGYQDQILAGLNWLLRGGDGLSQRVDILNASLGTAPYSDMYYQAMADARDVDGIQIIASIGNAGQHGANNHSSPGNYDVCIGVGATDQTDAVCSFSDWGTVSAHPGLAKPNLSAPGNQIWSAKPGGGYRPDSGTSMASPLVAGAAALVMEKKPTTKGNPAALTQALNKLLASFPAASSRGGRGRLDLGAITNI